MGNAFKASASRIYIRVHQNIKKFSEFYSHLIYICCIYMKEDQKKQKTKYFWDVLLAWPRFCRKEYFLQNGGLAQKIIFFCIFGLLLYRYNIYISSENIILKTFWYFGAPYWSYSLLKRWKHVGQNLHLLDQAWESGWEPWWVSLSLLHKQPWCYAIKIETEKRWDLVPLWWGSRRMNN